ncbi:hypothetical protein JL721_2284 [Aureococcus anophagefferens]|nr:hypothetical protein JL721_2284 [Aureococcus anophagefferens]
MERRRRSSGLPTAWEGMLVRRRDFPSNDVWQVVRVAPHNVREAWIVRREGGTEQLVGLRNLEEVDAAVEESAPEEAAEAAAVEEAAEAAAVEEAAEAAAVEESAPEEAAEAAAAEESAPEETEEEEEASAPASNERASATSERIVAAPDCASVLGLTTARSTRPAILWTSSRKLRSLTRQNLEAAAHDRAVGAAEWLSEHLRPRWHRVGFEDQIEVRCTPPSDLYSDEEVWLPGVKKGGGYVEVRSRTRGDEIDSLGTFKLPAARLRPRWMESRTGSMMSRDLLKDFEKLKGEVAGREAFRTQLEQLAGCQKQAPEAMKPLVEERMAELYGKITWSDPARGLVVCLLCGGMGACVYAMYGVGLKIARVINWEIDRLARAPLEKFCRAKGIEYASPMPSAARARREEAPGAAVPVEGNVCRLTAADVPADVDVLSSTGPCQDLSRANARRKGYSGANATPHFANSAFLWRAAARRAPGNAERFDRPRRTRTPFCARACPSSARTRGRHCHNRPRSLHSSFPPADRAERGYATYQALLDDLHGPGVFEALVPRLPCFRAGFPPRDAAKRRVADDTTHAVGLEEALMAMGFPADWFDGLGLDDRDAWRILGNSVHVPPLPFYGSRSTRAPRRRRRRERRGPSPSSAAAPRRPSTSARKPRPRDGASTAHP